MVEAFKGVGNDLFSEESLTNFRDAFTSSASRLQSEGVDLEGYTMPEVVEDIEAARIALGYERINLFSESYGTRVAMIYSWTHPGKHLPLGYDLRQSSGTFCLGT